MTVGLHWNVIPSVYVIDAIAKYLTMTISAEWYGNLKEESAAWLNETFPEFTEVYANREEIKADVIHKKEEIERQVEEKKENVTSTQSVQILS